MAYTTPATSVALTVLTAGFLNTNVRDNIAWLATDSPCCRAYNSAAFGIATATGTSITLNSERYDNAAMHSTSSNTSRITVPTGGGGKYLFGGGLQWQTGATGTRLVFMLLNATTLIAEQSAPGNASVSPATSVASVYALSAADYIEMQGYQDSGGGLNVLATSNFSPEFWALFFRT